MHCPARLTGTGVGVSCRFNLDSVMPGAHNPDRNRQERLYRAKNSCNFRSTGTPGLYVHPSEASHGDLSMITIDDVVIMLSNSGETMELKDVLAYSRRFSIPLIAITGCGDSTLAKAVDPVL